MIDESFSPSDIKIGVARREDTHVGAHDNCMCSSLEESSIALDEDRIIGGPIGSHAILPTMPERTLKEKLVERERQKRIETERARLKRQFALANEMMMQDEDENEEFLGDLHNNTKDGSIVGTVGEGSSVAIIREDDEKAETLGYAMERFLSEQGQKKREIEPSNMIGHNDDVLLKKEEPGGVVMERFLSEPVLVLPPSDEVEENPTPSSDIVSQMVLVKKNQELEHINANVPISTGGAATTVSFDSTPPHSREVFPKIHQRDGGDSELYGTAGSVSYASSVGDQDLIVNMNSMDVDAHSNIAQVDDLDRFTEPDSPSQEPLLPVLLAEGPRVLRLTEREIQEMAAIEEASIGNAPPSEREDTLSEVGDLVGSYTGGRDLLLLETPTGDFSIQTHTTASVSNTSAGGNQSRGGQSNEVLADQHSIDALDTASVSSHLVLSLGGSQAGVSLTANPPSVVIPNEGEDEPTTLLQPPEEVLAPTTASDALTKLSTFDDNIEEHVATSNALPISDADVSALRNANIINRSIPPGVAASPTLQIETKQYITRGRMLPNNELNKKISMSERLDVALDGFSYMEHDGIPPEKQPYTSNLFGDPTSKDIHNSTQMSKWGGPSMIRSTLDTSREKMLTNASIISGENLSEIRSVSQGVNSLKFDRIHTENNYHEEEYKINIWTTVVPKRFRALVITFILEIPVLFIISGGSDPLHLLIGQKRYQLLMGFLPLSNAISGSCSLEASTLTSRALSQRKLKRKSIQYWLQMEIASAALLGLGMGTILGISAFTMSGFDIPFAISIFVAQFVSVQVAGFMGTLTPLIFHHYSGILQGLLETAIQDLVGSFAMVVLSYHLLAFFGSSEIDSSTVCSASLN